MLISAVYIIKPEAYSQRDKIRGELRRVFSIRCFHTCCIVRRDIEQLYPDINSRLLIMSIFHLKGICEVGRIDAIRSWKDVVQFVGESPSPKNCSPNSIRRRFGFAKGLTISNQTYFRNGVHVSRSSKEWRRDAKILFLSRKCTRK